MKPIIQKLLLFIVLLCVSITASATVFNVNGIYYSIISSDDMTCMVVGGEVKSSGHVTIPSVVTCEHGKFSVTAIGEYAFYECSSLKSVTISDSVTEIGMAAFYECTSLTSVTIGSSLTTIGNGVFCGCYSLASVTIPDSVTEIGNHAFYNTSLTSVTLPPYLKTLGDLVFGRCSSLTEISISSDNQNFSTMEGVLFDKDYTTILAFPNAKCEEYMIPSSVTEIEYGAFYGCDSLTSVAIPESVTIIGNYAFYDCVSLTSVTIPESVTVIGNFAFGDCDSITSVTIPRGITGIGAYAFSYCDNLTSVYYNCEDPMEVNDNSIFDYTDEHATLYVPASAVEKCRLISPWKEFKNILAYDFSGVEYVGEGEVKTVSGRFDISGTTVDEKHKGMVIVRFSDGSVKKIIR